MITTGNNKLSVGTIRTVHTYVCNIDSIALNGWVQGAMGARRGQICCNIRRNWPGIVNLVYFMNLYTNSPVLRYTGKHTHRHIYIPI